MLSLHFKGLWIVLGIEQFIHLTIINTSLDVELMSVALELWSKSFLLPFGPISIILRDITILTGPPIRGADALCLLDIQGSSLPTIEVSSTTQTLNSVVVRKWHDIIEVPLMDEHVEFLWVLLC